MIGDDGDAIRGLGFVAMYSAWVEEDIDDLLRLLDSVRPFDEAVQRWQISRKLRHASELVRLLNSDELGDFAAALDSCTRLFERRNEVLHGRIYASPLSEELYVRSGRPSIPPRPISSAELYELATDFDNVRGDLIRVQPSRLPRAIERLLAG